MSLLRVQKLSVCFHKPVLHDLDLEVHGPGILNLMGPSGAGKSTFLRTVAGLVESHPGCRTAGEVHYLGAPAGRAGWPKLVEQKPPLLLLSVSDYLADSLPGRDQLTRSEQRDAIERFVVEYSSEDLVAHLDESVSLLPRAHRIRVSVLAGALTGADLLMVDEPTFGLAEEDAAGLLDLLERLAEQRGLIVVLHNQQHAARLGGDTALLAGGRIIERAPTSRFLDQPTTSAGADFVRTGSCSVPSPGVAPELLDEEWLRRHQDLAPPQPTPQIVPFGPSGFRWVERDRLAACPRPGLLGELSDDLAALHRAGITHLVSLEETERVAASIGADYGIEVIWTPIEDMQPPSAVEALNVARWIADAIDRGGRVAVHCKAGLGRTGTAIAAYYVFRGSPPEEALNLTRICDPRMVQSEEQEEFVHQFHEMLTSGEPDARRRMADDSGVTTLRNKTENSR